MTLSNTSQDRIMDYFNFIVWFLFSIYCTIRNMLFGKYKKIKIIYKIILIMSSREMSGRILRTFSTLLWRKRHLNHALGPLGALPKMTQALVCDLHSANSLCLFIRWDLSQRGTGILPLRSVWKKKLHQNLINSQSQANGWPLDDLAT